MFSPLVVGMVIIIACPLSYFALRAKPDFSPYSKFRPTARKLRR